MSIQSISYNDQNNNRYFIADQELKYTPIKAAESSSGVYSGGEPRTETLGKERMAALEELALALVSNPKLQVEQRRMMTSVLSVKNAEGTKRCILGRSAERGEFEKLLDGEKE